MPALPKQIGVAVDLAGCPNRCRHCYLGIGPNRTLPTEVLAEAAHAFWHWKRLGEDSSYFDQVYVSSWYREPDYSDDYRELYELERELGRTEPRRYELLSMWRLARDPDYARWAKEIGPQVCQITFFGLEKVNDYFHRRRGAFADSLKATERLLEVGMVPRWQVFLTKPGMQDLDGLMDLIEQLRLRERVAALGREFGVFCHPPGLAGEAWNMEDLCIEDSELPDVPPKLMESTLKHFEGSINWQTEAAVVESVLAGETIEPYVPDEVWFFVNADYDVFTNYGGEIALHWCLGNFRRDSLDSILERFEKDAAPGLRAAFHVPDGELAERFGRTLNRQVYHRRDVKDMWIHRYAMYAASRGSR